MIHVQKKNSNTSHAKPQMSKYYLLCIIAEAWHLNLLLGMHCKILVSYPLKSSIYIFICLAETLVKAYL